MKKNTKKEILVFLTTISILTLLLSISLSNMVFKKGMPLPIIDHGQGTIYMPDNNISSAVPISKLAKIIFIIITTVGIIIIAYKIIRKINWKDLSSVFPYILLIILALLTGLLAILFFLPHSRIQSPELIIKQPQRQQWSQLGETPAILVLFIAFFLVLLIALLIIVIFKSKKQKNHTPYKIELEATNAINEIQKGKDLKNVIIECYHKMCLALQDEQEIKREESMTVEEFEKRIVVAGAPQKSVHQLTRLFEAVRYGNWEPGSNNKKEAIKCFHDIIRYFSEIRKD